PKQQSGDTQTAAAIAALSARVESLERQLAQLSLPDAPKTDAPQKSPDSPSPRIDSPPISASPVSVPPVSLESRIGSQLFSRIGIIALLVGATWFLKLAMDNHWIGPLGRILAGLIAGTAIVLWSERFRRHGFNAFSCSLKAIGSGVLYLSLWAAFQLYHLLPATVALAAMILVTAWNAYMAWSQDSEILAAYALAGGFATPLLLSTGANHEIFLFTYILAIDIATIALVRLKPWPRLLLGAFPATVVYFIGWYVQFNSPDQLAPTTLFIALFFLTFLSPAFQTKASPQTASSITEILLPLANAAFASLALYSLLEDSGHHALLPWLVVLFGVIYLLLMRLPQSRVASAIHLSLAIVFLTIAIPLKASGRWITIGWLAEGVALLWISAHLSIPAAESTHKTGCPMSDGFKPDVGLLPPQKPSTPPSTPASAHPANAHRILRWLAISALALGFFSLLTLPFWLYHPVEAAFFNRRFATSLVGLAALATAAWIALHASRHPDEASPTWLQIAGASIIAFNLVALLACVRELDTVWRHTTGNLDADLQKSLAISTFLMLYGAILLAIGFWKRSAFLRWQALILLVFTIGKTFLYDMRDLSQGYRVVSFLGLGVLLMAISFAYQKDWLALREPESEPESEPAPNPTPEHPTGASQ
ncbi:MAG: DUF2339 domain-containing protein, partial [Edaphobacter sp.]